MAGIFNASVFNNAIFNTAEVAAEVFNRPAGWYPQAPQWKTAEERREERERLGIIPKAAEKVIAQVARTLPPDKSLEKRLTAAIAAQKLRYRSAYLEIARLEIEKLRQEEDDEIAVLLLMN